MSSTFIILLCMAAPAIYVIGSLILAKRKSAKLESDTCAVMMLLHENWQGQDDTQIMHKTGLSSERLAKTHYLLLNMGAELTPEGKWVMRRAA